MLHISQRKSLYRDLAVLFSYPDDDLLELLGNSERWAAAAKQLATPFPATESVPELTVLEETYTALFDAGLGGAAAPPYGSVYLDQPGLLMGPSTREVAACYADAGLRLDGTVEPADFLPTELEYLFYLVDREEQAIRNKDLAGAREMTGRQRRFLEQWLLSWLPEFVARLAARPQLVLYPAAGRFLLAYCQAELSWLQRLENAGG